MQLRERHLLQLVRKTPLRNLQQNYEQNVGTIPTHDGRYIHRSVWNMQGSKHWTGFSLPGIQDRR